MCLLDEVEGWDAASIRCRSHAHADPENPLRRDGRLPAVCLVELGLQAMALHGALLGDGPQPQGLVTSLGEVEIPHSFADGSHEALAVRAELLAAERRGYVYRFEVSAGGVALTSGRAVIMLPAASS